MSRLSHSENLHELRISLRDFGALAEGDLGATVPTCPGWELRSLVGHLGRVHRMALAVITTGAMSPAPPKELEPVPDNDNDLRAYFSSSSRQLLHDLEVTDPASPCWTFLGTADEVGFWSRRMAHEHRVHLYDALRATHVDPTLPGSTRSACDAIDEWVLIANARTLTKRPDFDLGGTIHLHATDDDQGEWMLKTVDGRLHAEPGHGKGTSAVRGTSADLLLGLWGRFDLTADARFQRFGSEGVIATLAGVGGN